MSILPGAALSTGSVRIAEEPRSYRRTFMFDFEKGEFAQDTMNRVRSATEGKEILLQIVSKILSDARYRYLAYTNHYGNEVHKLIAQDYPREILESELKRVYTEALIFHPLIADVRDFSFEGEDDQIYCSFTVV